MSFFNTAGRLTDDFASVAGKALIVSAVFDLAYADRTRGNDNDPEMKVAKPMLKMMLAGMLM